jgi:ribulose kinase
VILIINLYEFIPTVLSGASAARIIKLWMDETASKHEERLAKTADKRWFSTSGLGEELTSPYRKEPRCFEMLHKAPVTCWFFGGLL